MGEYITIIWDTETPSAAEVPWDNCMLLVQGSEASLSSSTLYALTSDDWSTVLTEAGFSAGSQAYKSTSIFFAASPTPGCTLYVLALVSGSVDIYENTSMLKVTDYIYETPIKPPLGFYGDQQVRYFPDKDETGYWVNKADGSLGLGFEVEVDGAGEWNGRLNFEDGLSGNIIDKPPREGCKITCSFRIGSQMVDIGTYIENLNINMLAAAYPNSRTTENYTTTYFGNQADDLLRLTNMIAGKNVLLFYALPGAAEVGESGLGFSVTWANLKDFIGQREDVALLKATPSSSSHDMGAGYMGMTAGTHPHTTMSFAIPHMGIQNEESLMNRNYWNDGQIASPMEKRQLEGSPYLISHGFTLGTGYSSRINYVRCKYIISANLINGLWALLASRTVKMSYNGMQLVKNKISGIFRTLQTQGIHDGLAYVKIPIEEDLRLNTEAGQAARLALTIPSIEIGFYWYSSLERIIITGIRNEA